jgi:hypothetical protein
MIGLCFLISIGFQSFLAHGYSVDTGDVLVRPVVGAQVNVLRLDVATRETPMGAMLMGVDLDYSFTGDWNLTGTIRPGFSPGFVDATTGVGVKYRLVQLETPYIPYASGMLVGSIGGPLRFGAPHLNAGFRGAIGMDYFVMRNLAVGIEAAADSSILAWPMFWLEASTEVLLGVSWRF